MINVVFVYIRKINGIIGTTNSGCSSSRRVSVYNNDIATKLEFSKYIMGSLTRLKTS